ncbi:MAG: DNA repair protein [Oscillospiraceae bacterium]|nr:DNA repair protein [Oscillospiraceae bacterium]
MQQRQYLCIDQRSFYATAECVSRGLDPLEADLVVADAQRSENTICLAVSVHLKKRGVKNRCRLKDIPPNMDVIIAPPRMQHYIDVAAEIYGVFLKYLAPEDIYVYSIDEAFLDVTPYLKMYGISVRELAGRIMEDVHQTVGTLCACGIGTNLYLSKIALDILAKHAPDSIGILDEEGFRSQLWDHKPITDFWRISTGTESKLRKYGITTQRQIAMCSEELLYRLFGIDAELLIDHAWGRESTTIPDIKHYKSKSRSLSSSQVLMRDYKASEGELIVKEMADQMCLQMAAQNLVTDSVSLYVGYAHNAGPSGTGGTAKFARHTNLASEIVPAVASLYRRVTDSGCTIRRVGISCNQIIQDTGAMQLNLFEDTATQLRGKALQETINKIHAKYGKNALLKGMNYEQAATTRERNGMIGGHRSGNPDS